MTCSRRGMHVSQQQNVPGPRREVGVKSGKLTGVTVEIDPFKPEIFQTKSNNCERVVSERLPVLQELPMELRERTPRAE